VRPGARGKARLTKRAQTGVMAWLLMLLLPVFAVPLLRTVLFPVRRGPAVPWGAIGIAALLFAALWFGVGQNRAPDSGSTYADADATMRALIEKR